MSKLRFFVDESAQHLDLPLTAFVIEDLRIPVSSPGLSAELEEVERKLLETSSASGLKREEALRSFRQLHAMVGPSARAEVAAPEILLSILHKQGRLPRVNTLVDIYNMCSAEARIAIGAHDVRHIRGDIRLTVTTGAEYFVPLGSSSRVVVPGGEYAYADDIEILCRLEVRQCNRTKVTTDTTDCFFVIQGSPAHTVDDVDEVVGRVTALVTKHCGGAVRHLWPSDA